MSKSAVQAELVDAWRGEIFGQALMRRLRTTLTDADAHDIELRQIERVERLMAAVLVTAIGPIDESEAWDVGTARSRDVAKRVHDWATFSRESATAILEPLARFQALVPIAPVADATVVALLIEHEEALGFFLQRAASGMPVRCNDALDGIERALKHYLDEAAAPRS